ncbi:MAG: SpoIIE family protein phosphatase [Roseovarius sp.]|nr:SpoIIE family protein phosphatase [Roseovarius sp.]
MPEILAVDLPDEVVAQLALGRTSVVRVDAVHAAEHAREDETVAVVAPASVGVVLAQSVHSAAAGAAVLYLTDDAAGAAELNTALGLTPGIGRNTSAVAVGDAAGLHQELEGALLAFEHRRAMSRVRSLVDDFQGGSPETLSVYLGRLFDHAPLGILLADPTGTVRAANPASADLLGWPARQMVGVGVGTLLATDQDAADLVERCVGTGARVEATLTRTGPHGTVQHLDVSAAPVDPEHWSLGVFVLLRDETERIEALAAAEVARSAAVAEAERYAELAWTLQESLLPPDLPSVEGVAVGARFHPAGDGSEIGGDFFDIFQISDAEWFAVVGDICGKGAGAARLTALTRYTLRATTVRTKTIERNLSDLNDALSRQYEQDRPRGEHRFATAAALRFQVDGDGSLAVTAGSGGHAPPLVVRAGGQVEELACRGPLLGVFPTGTFVSDTTTLAPGDVVVLYTDGVTEARRGREEFGDDRLHDLLASVAGRPADEVAGTVEDAVLRYQSGVARDDIAVLALAPRAHQP